MHSQLLAHSSHNSAQKHASIIHIVFWKICCTFRCTMIYKSTHSYAWNYFSTNVSKRTFSRVEMILRAIMDYLDYRDSERAFCPCNYSILQARVRKHLKRSAIDNILRNDAYADFAIVEKRSFRWWWHRALISERSFSQAYRVCPSPEELFHGLLCAAPLLRRLRTQSVESTLSPSFRIDANYTLIGV